MPDLTLPGRWRWSREHTVGVTVVLALLVLLAPLPGFVLDLLLAVSLAAGLAVLLVALLSEGPLGFPTLPGVLVAGSLARVTLAIAVARSVLARGEGGALVRTLGSLLTGAGDNLAGGVVVLGLLMLAGYVVLNLGLMRLAEVAARFALDALPGRQMALDAALNAGRTEPAAGAAETARLQAENAFYGAMDGAARFVRGETMAVTLIVVLVPLAGLASGGGTVPGGADLAGLALGLGLAVLVPALLTMGAAALTLARTAAESPATPAFRPGLLVVVAVALAGVAALPGVAKAPLLVAAGAAGALAWYVGRPRAAEQDGDRHAGEVQLRLGASLLGLTARPELMPQLQRERLALSDELGFAVPPCVVTDEAALPPNDFALTVNGACVLQATLRPGRRLAVPAHGAVLPPEGEPVSLPDGRAAVWVREGDEGGNARDVHLLDPLEALGLYLRAGLAAAAAELFSRQRAHELLAAVQASHPAVVAALTAAGLAEREVWHVGAALLAEGVPLTERVSLLEALADAGPGPTARLVESVRPALRRTITRLAAPEGVLRALALDGALAEELAQAVERGRADEALTLRPDRAEAWGRTLQAAAPAVVLCPPELRSAVAQLAREAGARVMAVQAAELMPLTEIIRTGVLAEHGAGVALAPAPGR